ncbi:MAG: ElyC/SanA/YdcF family protein, partial [bacterium]
MSRPGSGLPTLAAVLWLVGAYALTVALFGGRSRPRPAAVGVVLGTTARGDEPGAALAARLEAARRAHADGLVPVRCVSGARRAGGYDESRVMRAWLVAHGVPDSAVVRDSLGATTRATARVAAAGLAAHGGGGGLGVTRGVRGAR